MINATYSSEQIIPELSNSESPLAKLGDYPEVVTSYSNNRVINYGLNQKDNRSIPRGQTTSGNDRLMRTDVGGEFPSVSNEGWSPPSNYNRRVTYIDSPRRRRLQIEEKILEWQTGEVVNIDDEEGFFTAILANPTTGKESRAEFDIESHLSDEQARANLFVGATFTFVIKKVISPGKGVAVSSHIEFFPVPVWTEAKAIYAQQLYNEWFSETVCD